MDQDEVAEFMGRVVADFAATGAAGFGVVGHRLGLYPALAEGPATPGQFAEHTGCSPRYLTEWLRGQAAGGYATYDPATGEFSLTEEQAFCLADPNGSNVPAAFLTTLGYLRAEPRIAEAFGTGAGVAWHEYHEDVHLAVDAFYRPASWPRWCRSGSPHRTGSRPSSSQAAGSPTSAADSAPHRCSSRRPTRTRLSPARTTTPSRSSWRARRPPRPASATGSASRWPRRGPSPARTTTWWRCSTPCTTWAPRSTPRNVNPVGRMYYNGSTFLCVPNALTQPGGHALGAQAGEAATRQVVTDAGFTRFRRVLQTPFNVVYEARP